MPSDTLAIGIDPGLSGAIALVQWNSQEQFILLSALELPMSNEGELHVHTFHHLIESCRRACVKVFLEQAVACKFTFAKGNKRIMSAESGYKIGLNYGRITATLDLKRIPYEIVHPRTWTAKLQKGMPKELTSKEKSLKLFLKLCSTDSQLKSVPPRCRNHHDGIIDAALIAWWGLLRQ